MNETNLPVRQYKRETLPVPTQVDFEQYRGGHTHRKWAQVGDAWFCPSCKRTKFEQLTWTRSRTGNGRVLGPYKWLAPIVEHHDHGADRRRRVPRFPPTLVCFDCNAADGRVKRMLALPSDFSFSPAELSTFITGHPHHRVTEDRDAARTLANILLQFRL
jgi:hypothetical protein